MLPDTDCVPVSELAIGARRKATCARARCVSDYTPTRTPRVPHALEPTLRQACIPAGKCPRSQWPTQTQTCRSEANGRAQPRLGTRIHPRSVGRDALSHRDAVYPHIQTCAAAICWLQSDASKRTRRASQCVARTQAAPEGWNCEKGLRDRNSPTCTLSQNGYGVNLHALKFQRFLSGRLLL